ncbi:MAG: response regulator [Methanoregulaceae archaeon]|jgi:two-component sensor histidine kinase
MSGETILIVEDEAITAMAIRKNLVDQGYSVIGVVPTGEQAVGTAIEQEPDLILMDIQLAGKMNGIVAAKLIRDQTGVPVIFLTAYSDDRVVRNAEMTGPYGYLVKPVREGELEAAIGAALRKHARELESRTGEEMARVLRDDYADMHVLQVIGDYLFTVHGIEPGRITLDIHTGGVSLPIDRAIPISLITNELLTNSLKHAFPDPRKGTIRISLVREEGACRYVYHDDGVGFPEDLDLQDPKTLGLQLVHQLAGQIPGSVSIERGKGMTVEIVFAGDDSTGE